MNYIIKSNLDNDNLRRKKNSGMHNNIFLKFRYEISIPNGNLELPLFVLYMNGSEQKNRCKIIKKKTFIVITGIKDANTLYYWNICKQFQLSLLYRGSERSVN